MFPKIVSFGDFFLPTYGLLVAGGFLIAVWLAGKLAARTGLSADAVMGVGVYSALAGLVGAKLLMFVLDYDFYLNSPSEIVSLSTLQAGGVFYGGFLVALGVGYFLIRRARMPLLRTLDVFAAPLALGQTIGRLGCFAAGCCWGVECRFPWAVTFTSPDAARITGVPLFIPLHPTQLYEAALYAVVFGITYRSFSLVTRPGRLMGLYLVLSSSARFGVEFFRYHAQPSPFAGPLSTTQWIAVAVALLGFALWRWPSGPALRDDSRIP